jgi:hypothetical protein
MIALSARRLALFTALFFLGGFQARPVLDALLGGRGLHAVDLTSSLCAILVAAIGISKSRRIPA